MRMSTGSVEYARVDRHLRHPIDRIWEVAGCFGGIAGWVEGVTACSLQDDANGTVRTVTLGGRSVRERMERCDPEAHELVYLVLEPHGLPAREIRSTIKLEPAPGGGTRFLWLSEAGDLRASPKLLGERIEAFYAASIERLDRLLAKRA
jgi:hypothetical protein